MKEIFAGILAGLVVCALSACVTTADLNCHYAGGGVFVCEGGVANEPPPTN